MNNFRVGEIAILRCVEHAPELNGQQCEVILPEAVRTFINPATGEVGQGLRYIIRAVNGRRGAVSAGNLIKRLPPPDETAQGRQAALQCIKKAMSPAFSRA